MSEIRGDAYRVVQETAPVNSYRGAVVGCGRMGSTIDDEHIGMPNYPWPWAHAPAVIEARGIELVAASDTEPDRLDDFSRRWGTSSLFTDYREMVRKEQPDVVCLTTRPDPRAEITIGLAELGVKAIFVETSVNPRLINEIAKEAGVVVGGKLYSDSMGVADSAGETYLGMMRENTLTIVQALK